MMVYGIAKMACALLWLVIQIRDFCDLVQAVHCFYPPTCLEFAYINLFQLPSALIDSYFNIIPT